MQVEELWAAGPQSGVAGGLWPRQGPGTLRGTSLDSVAQHGQAEECGTCACSARAAAAPVLAPLALLVSVLHTQAAERDPQLLSRTGPVGVFSNTRTSYAGEEAVLQPQSFLPYQPGSVLTTTTPHALQHTMQEPRMAPWGCGLMEETCCPRRYSTQHTRSSSSSLTGLQGWGAWESKDQSLVFMYCLLSVGKVRMDVLFL